MNNTIKGILHVIYETKQITDKFKKKEFVLFLPNIGYRDSFVKFSLIQNSCDLLNGFTEGDSVSVSYSLEGREWKNPKTDGIEYFNDVRANSIRIEEEEIKIHDVSGDGDDLPF